MKACDHVNELQGFEDHSAVARSSEWVTKITLLSSRESLFLDLTRDRVESFIPSDLWLTCSNHFNSARSVSFKEDRIQIEICVSCYQSLGITSQYILFLIYLIKVL
ncbi:hypothetical protein CDAR_245371 [Caerostris darwini]|uniref:Uncharacterized protein n=1 Tax=Caerostris darwini TaxID=1538125 RepID=A0AAV4P195_9ARAC|nr:hypothetical protein CDAR_245371 [Caerostris darwini]